MNVRRAARWCGWLLWFVAAVRPASAQVDAPQPVQLATLAQPPGLVVHFLDAGAGDAAWVVMPDNSSVLIDCGPPELSKQLLLQLQAAGLTTIDLLAPGRSTPDASGGCADVVRYLRVRSVLWSPGMSLSPAVRGLDTELANANVDRETGVAGWTREYLNARLTLFNPSVVPVGNPNDDSQVLLLEYGASGVLFAGGIHDAGEAQLRAATDPQAQPTLAGRSITVLRAADHGAPGTNEPNFLRQVFPGGAAAVVVSDSAVRGAAQPDAETRQRLAGLVSPRGQLLETARHGSITLTLGFDGSLSVSTDR
ncbi:MAG TPA: hypothetical protein VKV73_08050 [Chloroflexota bacterium]|nr:hypothetical protein [Chloroflexota bacterium]